MNAEARTGDHEVGAQLGCGVQQSRVSRERSGDGATIGKIDG
jgi:hypothetical protein